jgi:hypothetical protein
MQAVYQGCFIPQRLKYNHIPGPTPTWLLGHTHIVMKKYNMLLFRAFKAWSDQYGPVFKWFWGPQPVITVCGKQRFGHHLPCSTLRTLGQLLSLQRGLS